MPSLTARQEIARVLLTEKWEVSDFATSTTLTAVSPQGRRRKITIVFNEKGSVIKGCTIEPRPFNFGTSVLPLSVPRRISALKFIRGEA